MIRSLFFTPGDDAHKVEKSFTLGADAVVLDLEDAVAKQHKASARQLAAQTLSKPLPQKTLPKTPPQKTLPQKTLPQKTLPQPMRYVRVNSCGDPECLADLSAVVGSNLHGIVLPLVESSRDLEIADWALTQLEQRAGMQAGSLEILPIIETCRGLGNIGEICSHQGRLRRLSFGSWDYCLDAGMLSTPHEGELEHARTMIVHASAAAGLEKPLDTSWIGIGDIEGLKNSARRARQLGFGGKACIHPEQLPVIHQAFSPSASEIAQAQRIVEAFEQSAAQGTAAIVVDGQFVDYTHAERAQQTLELAKAISAKNLQNPL